MNRDKKSVLNPVGKVVCRLETPHGGTTGIAQVDLSLAPVGTELYVQPSEGRLKLEIEVANDNALAWQKALSAEQVRNKQLRTDLQEARALLQRSGSFELNADLNHRIEQFLRQD